MGLCKPGKVTCTTIDMNIWIGNHSALQVQGSPWAQSVDSYTVKLEQLHRVHRKFIEKMGNAGKCLWSCPFRFAELFTLSIKVRQLVICSRKW